MSELVTLSKNSAEFESYLLGTFAMDKRALPVQTLNVNSASETVTFRVVDLKNISRPSMLEVLAKTFKVRSFLLILVPLFLILTKNIVDRTIVDVTTTVLATVGVFLAFAAVNLRNDYMDHMKGIDRVFETSGSRAIQNGWVTAAQVKTYSTVLLALSVLCALPLIFAFPILAGVIAGGLAIGLWAQFNKKNSFKYRIGGELSLFVMLGPLLTTGYQLAMGARPDAESFWIGCLWGWAVLFIVHLRNFSNILPSLQAGFSNTVNWLGFDKARRMLAAWWGLFVVFNFMYHYVFAGFYWGVYTTFVLALFSAHFTYKLKTLSSPIGSELRSVFQSGYYLILLTIGLWVFECLWYLRF